MADVTPYYEKLRDAVYATGVGKEELKALPNLPSKAQLIAAFQTMENGMLASRDPYALAEEVRGLAARNETGLARAVLEVGLARFPDHPGLGGLLDLLSRARA